jgi:ABC-2 type transport system permease protein
MGTWWKGTRLVFERGLVENLRSKSFKVVTGLLLLLSIAAVTLPQLFRDDTTTYTLATVGDAPADLVATLNAAGDAGAFDVEYVTRDNPQQLRQAVRDGAATVGFSGDTLYAAAIDAGTFPVVVAQAAVTLETTRTLAEAGLSPQQVAQVQSIRPPEQFTVAAVEDEGRATVGFAVGIVLMLALLFAGTAIATTVALEKCTRISEVLLAVLRPSQILVGTVLSVGTVTFSQLVVLAAPLAIAVRVTDKIGPSIAAGDIALAIAWFLLGFALYAFLYAASGALVGKVTEVDVAVRPIALAIFAGYFVATFIVMEDPQGVWSVLASIFPITAPLAMPVRWASGEVPTYQLLLAMALTAGTAVAFVALASAVYRRALLITGQRLRFRDVIGKPAEI